MDVRKEPIGRDSSGFEAITEAIRNLLNQFPGLLEGEIVKFEELGEDKGIAFSNNSGALVYAEKRTITGVIHQECRYPFFLVYRMQSTKERQKLIAQQFLDVFGKWICREPNIYERNSVPIDYPNLTNGRTITRIIRDNLYAQDPQKNGAQDWILPVTVEYTNKYKK